MIRLPNPGSDAGDWGDLLNSFLLVEHESDGSLRPDGSLAKKYEKPVSGIPYSDMTPSVQKALTNAQNFTNKLAGLSDVNVRGLSDAQVLSYSTSAATWLPVTPVTDAQLQGLVSKAGDTMSGPLTISPGAGNNGLTVKTQFASNGFMVDLNGNTVAYQKLSVGGSTATSTHTVNGSLGFGSARSVGAATTLGATDCVVFANSAGGAFTVTLPSFIGLGVRMYIVKKIDSTANTVTVATISSQPIDVSQTTISLANQNDFVVLLSDNVSGWKIIASSITPVSRRVTVLTDTATITPHPTTSDICTVTLGGNRTVANPSGAAANGQDLCFRIKQDTSGSRTITWDTKYRFSADIPRPVLSTAPGKTDYIRFMYNTPDDAWDCVSVTRGF